MFRIALSLLCAVPLCANLIQNPGFEAPTLAGSTTVSFTDPNFVPNWTWLGPGAGMLIRDDYSEAGGSRSFPANSGENALDITGPGWTGLNQIYQDIATLIGTLYTVQFYLGNQSDSFANYGQPSVVDLLVDGVVIASPTFASNNGSSVEWQLVTTQFTATNATTRIQFRNATPSSDNYAGLDDVFVDTATTVIPEPASGVVVGLALCALGLARRKN